jgi:hypothetical protein
MMAFRYLRSDSLPGVSSSWATTDLAMASLSQSASCNFGPVRDRLCVGRPRQQLRERALKGFLNIRPQPIQRVITRDLGHALLDLLQNVGLVAELPSVRGRAHRV